MYKHKSHPWHGIDPGGKLPEEVRAFIEIVPTDTVKYEVDKKSGYLSIDRPQKYSNIVPALYGFLPQSYCGPLVAEPTNLAVNRTDIEGDGDPLDICVLTEKDVTHGDILVWARPIGGLRLIDRNQADDKIIAVMRDDLVYEQYRELKELPESVLNRLIHYFTTYKDLPSDKVQRMQLVGVYDSVEAHDVIMRSLKDYDQVIAHRLT